MKDYSYESMNFDIDYQLLGGTKPFTGLVITFSFFPFCPFFLSFFLLSCLMSAKVTWKTCNKSISYRNLIEGSICFTIVHLKCIDLNVVDAEVINITGSDIFWVCMYWSNNLFPFASINNHKP